MELSKQAVLEALRGAIDPSLDRDIVSLQYVQHVAVCDGFVTLKLAMEGGEGERRAVEVAAREAMAKLGDGVKRVDVEFVLQREVARPQAVQGAKPQAAGNPLPNVRHIVAVGAGKGGVGKSMVAVNLAVGMARHGLRVGLLDGDIYGPSVPTMLGLADMQPTGTADRLDPFEVHGIKTMTIGKLVDADKPLIWRGPMAHGAFRQIATQTDWGELDVLVVDLPPGTGDVPLTLSQTLPLRGAVIVCTPQKVAQDDAVRATRMFEQLNVPVLGVVENMSYFIGDDGKEYDLFGRGGAAKMAARLGLPVLGVIPIGMSLRINSDAGDPTANFTDSTKLAVELDNLVVATIRRIEQAAGESSKPALNVH